MNETVFRTAIGYRLARRRIWPEITCVASSSLVKRTGDALGAEALRWTCVRCLVECQYIDGTRRFAFLGDVGVTVVDVVSKSVTNERNARGGNASPPIESRTQTSTCVGSMPRLCSSESGNDPRFTSSQPES